MHEQDEGARRPSNRRRPTSKIYWNRAEKEAVARNAAEIQHDHPDMAGLRLIRAAQKILPPHRQRKLVGMEQAKWFDDAVRTEVRKRTDEIAVANYNRVTAIIGNEQDPYVPHLQRNADANEAHLAVTREVHDSIREILDAVRTLVRLFERGQAHQGRGPEHVRRARDTI